MIGIIQPTTIVIRTENHSELIDSMSMECEYCREHIIRYDLRLHHYIWQCPLYPDEKKRAYFQSIR